METKNCIVCGKPAVHWTGHIHTAIGVIISGWCNEHIRSDRPRVANCTSMNPSSCGGRYSLYEIELNEELTEESLWQMRYSESFSNMVDSRCSPYWPHNK